MIAIAFAVLVVTFVVGVFSAGTACAHDPRFACSPRGAEHPITVPDPTKSWAYYGDLAPGETDRYVFTVIKPAEIPASLLLDARDAANPARPVAVLADRAGHVVKQLDLRAPVQFDERFSRVHYLSSPTANLHLAPGDYTVDVTMRGGSEPQRYTLAIGADERFSLTEIPFVLGAIYRIHNRKF